MSADVYISQERDTGGAADTLTLICPAMSALALPDSESGAPCYPNKDNEHWRGLGQQKASLKRSDQGDGGMAKFESLTHVSADTDLDFKERHSATPNQTASHTPRGALRGRLRSRVKKRT